MANLDDASPPNDSPHDPGDGRYCIDCHYPLTGLESPGKCPECGRFFNFRNIYSFTCESHPPSRLRRIFESRVVSLVAVLALNAIPFVSPSFACAAILFYPLWQFVVIWLWFRVTRIDHFTERMDLFVLFGAVIGFVSLLATGWTAFLLVGVLSGGACGGYMYYLKITGWLD